MSLLPDVPALSDPGLYQFLLALRKRVETDAIAATSVASSTASATGARDPSSLVYDYGGVGDGVTSNDTAISTFLGDAAQDTVFVRSGTYATGLTKSAFTKRFTGNGLFLLTPGGTALPADFGYMAVKPDTYPVQGETGWFRGDQKFTDGGEWKVLGPSVRTYDVTARYFESNTIPHHAWWDVESGNSGAQAYIPGGVTPGSSVVISGTASTEWVGKQVQIKDNFGGNVLATLTVASVAGTTVNFTTAHGVTQAWNPGAGSAPNLSFAPRTWNGFRYTRVRMRGGGDVYGDIVRINVEYVPKSSELVHVFNSGTAGQYGGSIDFLAGTSGTYATGWESQYNAIVGSPDVAVRGQVDSYVRNNDRADQGGRIWLGLDQKSEGTRPADSGYRLGGAWRRGLDTVGAVLQDGSYLTAQAASGASSITVKWTSGARVGGAITIAGGYSGTITSIAGSVIGISPNTAAVFPVDSVVSFTEGGAAIIMASGQAINWDGSESTTGRGADPLGLWGAGFGNETGGIWSGTDTDGGGEHWYTQIEDGTGVLSRIRLRPASFQVNVEIQGGTTISATKELVTNDSDINANFQGAVVFGAGLGEYITFNTSTGKWEFYTNSALVASLP